mmetsp:Transcript_2499/g.7385  ORF Transcript_2499/g.7385 Transcript_2499/m.7385 type:complete len:229 (-) Transcript_2499:863-1549(-)
MENRADTMHDSPPTTGRISVDPRNDVVAHEGSILLVVFTVLLETLLLVATCAVEQEDREEDGIEQGHGSVDERVAQQTPGPGSRQLEEVVEVARDSPEATGQQQRRLLHQLPVLNHGVLRPHELRLPAKDVHLTVGLPKPLALLVGPEVEKDTNQAQDEERHGHFQTQVRGSPDQDARVQRVERGHPDQTPPRFVETCSVHDDVDGAHVANLPSKELHEIEVLRHGTE